MGFATATVALLASGCTAAPLVQTMPLDRPARPALPAIAPSQLDCLDEQTYRALQRRDQQRRDYSETLETIIDATRGSDGR